MRREGKIRLRSVINSISTLYVGVIIGDRGAADRGSEERGARKK